MHETTHLANLILQHWRIHRPRMVAELQKTHQLAQAVSQAEEQATDRLYELLHLRKMQYQDAWELAMQDWLTPEETPSSWMTSANLPVISG
jgi:hypothetical protein